MEIETLSEEAWPRLRAIRLEALATDPDAFGSTHARCVQWSQARWREQLCVLTTFVAVIDGRDVGMVRCAVDPQVTTAVWLISMWVAPAVRRRGIAGALVDAVIEWARARHATEVRLDVRAHNRPAIGLYQREGFTPVGEAVPEPPPNEHILERRFVRPLFGAGYRQA